METQKFKEKFRIKSTRLTSWNYSSPGYYFVTICTKDKISYFGNIKNNKVNLSPMGIIVTKCWLEIPTHFPNVNLDTYVVMSTHIHGITIINDTNRRDGACPVSTLSNIIGSFKSASCKEAHKINTSFQWQPRFYDHVIRNEKSLNEIRKYILDNPLKWEFDEENPERKLHSSTHPAK